MSASQWFKVLPGWWVQPEVGQARWHFTDVLVQMLFSSSTVKDIRLDHLGSGPLAQPSMMMTPRENVFIVCGGTQERWALLLKYIAPAAACHLGKKKERLMEKTPNLWKALWIGWGVMAHVKAGSMQPAWSYQRSSSRLPKTDKSGGTLIDLIVRSGSPYSPKIEI